MKTAKTVVLVFLAGLLVAGCAESRKLVVDLVEEDLRNAEVMREASDKLLSTWALNSGAIRTVLELEVNPNKVPRAVWIAMDRLDAMARMPEDALIALSAFDRDFNRGAAGMLRIILSYEGIKKIIEEVAPGLMKYAGLLF